VRIISRKCFAAIGTPQVTAFVPTTDERIVDFGIGIAVTGLGTLTARAWADQNAIGKCLGAGALTHHVARFGKNVPRHLAKQLHHGSDFLGAGRFRQVRFAMPTGFRFFGHLTAAVPTAHHSRHRWERP
jgi:hypothetical protein